MRPPLELDREPVVEDVEAMSDDSWDVNASVDVDEEEAFPFPNTSRERGMP